TAGRDGGIRAWDIDSGRMILDAGDAAPVYDIDFYPDDADVMVTGGNEDVVMLWSLASGKPIARFMADHNALPVYAVAFSPASKLLATGHANGKVKVWKTGAWDAPLKTESTHTAEHPVQALAFSPDNKKLAIGIDTDVLLCDTAE